MRARTLVFKSILITFGVVLILAIAVFGIVSLAAPATMMRFTESLGLTEISGDYAFQEYERSGSISCLANSFIISAEHKRDAKAEERFELLYSYETEKTSFADFCAEQDKFITADGGEGDPETYAPGTYRAYLCGLAACVKYRLAKDGADKSAVIKFAVGETDDAFPAGNPSIALALEALKAEDPDFCAGLLAALRAGRFEQNGDFLTISGLLEGVQAE